MLRTVFKIVLALVSLLILVYLILVFSSKKSYPVEYGISFNQNHATSLGLDWKEVYTDMIVELQPQYIRIAAMWSEVEKVKNEFDYSDVDYMMDLAAEHDVRVVLVVGQKAPRWPECHVPGWFNYDIVSTKKLLLRYVEGVVVRYKDHPALELWQVENEPFIPFEFGDCSGFQRDAVYDEIELVRSLDTEHSIIITDSGELSTWRKASAAGDLFGTTLYRVVRTPKGRIFSYDWLPPAFYRWKARIWRADYSEQVFVSELQAEPWFTDSTPTTTPIAIQEETMNPDRLLEHIAYTERIGFSRAYLWGIEWWYYMKEEHEDARYWEIVRQLLQED